MYGGITPLDPSTWVHPTIVSAFKKARVSMAPRIYLTVACVAGRCIELLAAEVRPQFYFLCFSYGSAFFVACQLLAGGISLA